MKKYDVIESAPGLINSKPTHNSQTLHEGDIETNYNYEKAIAVKKKSSFTRTYVEKMNDSELSLSGPKMVLGIGSNECAFLTNRFNEFSALYPTLMYVRENDIREIEPFLLKGRSRDESICGLYNPEGLTINYGRLAEKLVEDARVSNSIDKQRNFDIYLSKKVTDIVKTGTGYQVTIGGEILEAKFVSVCAGAHSMYFAKKLKLPAVDNLSLLCVAGNFYHTPKYLHTKVYTVQNPKLPFSAVHGDPDILDSNKTRFGPTTRVVFMLERFNYSSTLDFFITVPPVIKSLLAYARIIFNRNFFFYALKHNILFQIPFLGNYLFVKEARKIIPSLRYSDLERAKKQGGVRPQIVDTSSESPLSLGEAKLAGDNILFNVTPSPGATTCIYNGFVDVKTIAKALNKNFNDESIKTDFGQTI